MPGKQKRAKVTKTDVGYSIDGRGGYVKWALRKLGDSVFNATEHGGGSDRRLK